MLIHVLKYSTKHDEDEDSQVKRDLLKTHTLQLAISQSH